MVSIIIPAKKAEVEFIVIEGNNPGKQKNQGAWKSKGEILAYIDSDAYPDPDWLREAVLIFKEDPTIGVVCGPNITPYRDNFWQKASGKVYEILGKERYKPLKRKEVEEAPSCNLLVRKIVFERVGGFPEDVWPGEDTVFCEKVLEAGYKIIYDPRVIVYHHRRGFIEHLKQIARYGQMRGRFIKLYPRTSCKLKYFMPSAVILLLLLSIIVYGINFIKGCIVK